MKYLTIEDQLRQERRKNEALAAQIAKQQADLDYTAMMSGVDLDTETEVDNDDEI